MTDLGVKNTYDPSGRTDFDPTVNRAEEQERLEQEQKDKSTLSFTDMLGLMVAQFQNQTIDNQASTSDMMNQLVQMSTMQAMNDMVSQIKELTLANVMGYAASLVGQTVTVGVYNEETKELEEVVGVVKGTGTYDGQQVIYLDNGKGYFLSEIMAVGTLPPKPEETPDPDEGEGDGGDMPPVDTENKEEEQG
ncbi:MAG: flagellar hook capping protein [Lawsonibacter sp.]|nr:flagellar hook capping protein [Lawsonibacter sp.]